MYIYDMNIILQDKNWEVQAGVYFSKLKVHLYSLAYAFLLITHLRHLKQNWISIIAHCASLREDIIKDNYGRK